MKVKREGYWKKKDKVSFGYNIFIIFVGNYC